MTRTTLTKLGCAYILLAVAQFAIAAAVAMAYYPGGNPFDDNAPGYTFWLNTICDLGKQRTTSGLANPVGSAILGPSLVVATSAFAPLWLMMGRLFPGRPRTVRVARALGLVSVVGAMGVGLFPADRMVFLHSLALSLASVPGLAALAVACSGMAADRRCPRWLAAWSAAFLCLALLHFWQFISHFWFGMAWMPVEPATQKVAVICGLGWMAACAGHIRRLAAGA